MLSIAKNAREDCEKAATELRLVNPNSELLNFFDSPTPETLHKFYQRFSNYKLEPGKPLNDINAYTFYRKFLDVLIAQTCQEKIWRKN